MDEESSKWSESEEIIQQKPESASANPRIHETLESISSLISLSHSIRVFSIKWQSIRNKLEELLSTFSAIEACNSNEINPSIFTIFEAISATIKDCKDHARLCLDLSYSGKLLMQSDLDILSKRLDNHVKSLSDVYSQELLSQNHAIVVSRPVPGASKDDIRFYISDLLSRLKIGYSDMTKQALIAFNEVIQEDERYVKISVEVDNFMGLLVNFLDFQENGIQEEAAKAVSVIAGFQSYRGVLIENGIIAPLIRILECGSELSKEYASRCLQKVTENSDNAWSVSAHGGVTALLKICTSEDSDSELINLACGVLKNLVGVEEIKRFVIEEGAIPAFIKLVKAKDEVTQICSIDFLQVIASGDEPTRQIILNEGGIRTLVRVLDPKSFFSSKAREMALRGIVNLCYSSLNLSNTLLSYNFMDHILYFLRFGEISIQELALKAAFWICGTSEEAKKSMGDSGFMQELVKFLDSKSFEVREMAAETLSSLIMVPRNRKRFVQNDQNVGLLLQMLDPQEANSGNRKLLLSILMSLTSSQSGRKKIVNSGFLKNIEKLAEAEVSDAKKIVRKLSSNRLRSIFSGMWNS